MPELPEVETIKNDLAKTVVGAKIVDFWQNSPKQILPSVGVVKKSIIGSTIAGVGRRGKLIILKMYNVECTIYNFLGIHLKMTGRLLLRRKDDPPDPYCHTVFFLEKNKQSLELRFCDTRKFGYIRVFGGEEELERIVGQKLGPEPFVKKFTVKYLQKIFENKKTSIKTVLMDQKLIAGIGNIYANEALFLAKIRPNKEAKNLGIKELKNLRTSIIAVLKKGIKYRGSSSRDESYKDLFGELGNYQNHFLVYEKKGQACPNQCGGVIQYLKLNGRGTFWCSKCQR